MVLKTPRWLLLLEAVLLLGAVLVLTYKAAMRILPLRGMEQSHRARKIDPQAQLLQNYRQYPDRYIRVTKESWSYDQFSRTATHAFTLRNSATVAYYEIEIRFSYESSSGKVLHTQTVKIPGALAALGTMNVEKIKVKNVPAASTRVVAAVANARF